MDHVEEFLEYMRQSKESEIRFIGETFIIYKDSEEKFNYVKFLVTEQRYRNIFV